MKSSFSELSYAFALTENLANAFGMPLVVAPSFPSTAAEGKKGAGHDVKLDYPGMSLFLQFKLSHCMRNVSAKEFASGKFPLEVSGQREPVYRMYLHPLRSSRQTSLLLQLEQRHGLVYYVAPLFHLPTDLSQHFSAKTVAHESRFIRPSVIKKMPDQNEHFVSFRRAGKPWRFSSSPQELFAAETDKQVMQRMHEEIKSQTTLRQRVDLALEHMFESLLDEAGSSRAVDLKLRQEVNRLRNDDEMPVLQKAAFVARNFFDVEFLAFGKTDAAKT